MLPILARALRQAMGSIGNLQGLKMTEQEHIEAARDNLRKAESAWAKAITHVKGAMQANAEKGRADLANAALGAAADLTDELASMMRSHWRVTGILLEKWPDWAAEVVTRGPPR